MAQVETKNVFITGGAGFFGSVFVERLLALPNIAKITVFDRNAKKSTTLSYQDKR